MRLNSLKQWFEEPLMIPRHLGHSRWHLFSPRYHLWKRTNRWREKPNPNVSGYWQEMRSAERDMLGVHAKYVNAISKGTQPYQQVADFLGKWQVGSILDVGCGDGIFQRYLVETKGMPLRNMWGCDLDPKRVRNAHRQMYIGALSQALRTKRSSGSATDFNTFDDVAVMEHLNGQFFQFDIMGTQPWPLALSYCGIEIVTLIAFCTSFNDAEMDVVARRIAELRPKKIIDVSLYENILEGYGGRRGIERFFAPHGYREVLFKWLPEHFRVKSLKFLWQERPYWPAMTLQVLERGTNSCHGSLEFS